MEVSVGTLYILHFQIQDKFCHYVGWTKNIKHRINSHRMGTGCSVSKACIALGAEMSYTIFARGTKADEEFLRLKVGLNTFSEDCKTCLSVRITK